jgi:hypothetical protein
MRATPRRLPPLEGCPVSAFNPLSQRCTARCKATQQQCRKWVVGGGPNAVCDSHGGRAIQVRRAKELRLATMKAELAAARAGLPAERRHPGEILLDAVAASDVLMQHLLRQRAAGNLSGEEALALGAAIDRAARTSRSALDAGVLERMTQVREKLTRDIVSQLIAVMDTVLADPRLIIDPADRGPVVVDAVRQLGLVDGQPAEQLALTQSVGIPA